MSVETKNDTKLWIALIGIFAFLLFQTFNTCESKQDTNVSRVDTIVSLAPPVTNNYHITNPTLTKETTIVYDSTKATLTKKDSDLIVLDYLKRREYRDSTGSDTAKVYYTAIVEKNALKNIDITMKYRPKVYTITKTKFTNGLFIGLAPAMINNNSLSIGANLNYQWKQYQVGAVLDLFKKNYYFYASKRVSFK